MLSFRPARILISILHSFFFTVPTSGSFTFRNNRPTQYICDVIVHSEDKDSDAPAEAIAELSGLNPNINYKSSGK